MRDSQRLFGKSYAIMQREEPNIARYLRYSAVLHYFCVDYPEVVDEVWEVFIPDNGAIQRAMPPIEQYPFFAVLFVPQEHDMAVFDGDSEHYIPPSCSSGTGKDYKPILLRVRVIFPNPFLISQMFHLDVAFFGWLECFLLRIYLLSPAPHSRY